MSQEQDKIRSIRKMLRLGNLADSLSALKEYAPMATYYPELAEEVEELEKKYRWLLCYYMKGAADPEREKIFDSYRDSLFAMVQNLDMMEKRHRNSVLMAAAKKSAALNRADVLPKLEHLVAEEISLEHDTILVEAQKKEKLDLLHKEYAEYVNIVFSHILSSLHWAPTDEDYYVSLIESPRIGTIAPQVFVSAIMMSCMCVYDFRKLKALARIYVNAKDVYVKERALVGWVFAMCYDDNKEEVRRVSELVQEIGQDDAVRHELLELQQQVLLCMDAEKDGAFLDKNIRSSLANSNLAKRATKAMMKDDLEDSSLEEILNPEKDEADMVSWEENFKRIHDMEKAGSDVYYSGFAKMKSYGFFHTFAHWFWPYWSSHPALGNIINKLGLELMSRVHRNMPFCDNDMYSFMLTTGMLLNKSGEQMIEVFKLIGSQSKKAEFVSLDTPTAVRRMYLQDLYRFFRLSSMAADFSNPFTVGDTKAQAYFLGHKEFQGKIFSDVHLTTCRFLARKKDYQTMRFFIDSNMPHGNDYAMVMALYEFHAKHSYEKAANHLTHILLMSPDNVGAVRLLARCYMGMGDYEQAIVQYGKLLRRNPEDLSVKLRMAYGQMQLGEYDEALSLLYELDYKQPGKLDVMRPLAWTQLKNGEVEKALKVYEKINRCMASHTGEEAAMDNYNHALALWCHRQTEEALERFAKCSMLMPDFCLYDQLMEDKDVLRQYGYTQMDVLLMVDMVQLSPLI